MEISTSPVAATLADDRFAVPPVPAGIEWLRCTVARFSTGADHERRRALAVELLGEVSPGDLRARAVASPHTPPVELLAEALGIHGVRAPAVSAIGRAYHPHTATDPAALSAADRAVAELVARCGGVPDERTAAVLGLLVQACDATATLVARTVDAVRRGGNRGPDAVVADVLRDDPPVRVTRRIDQDGSVLELDLAAGGLPFGAGPHRCPGQAHAVAIAEGVAEALD
ncbi:hypothetical protein SAMN05216266_113178 [Amycolatopsis marina]|uniref:Cytochrome P450 n=1 Tax=Amycolatopsis marina TaxID=490629 RepID=A0A1I1BJG7_9PSEU|nr:hypothetical protein [Amycolatopsis marina]SFB48630.1 hypothetical protein SAMN05216266_113178 [Amycolatopsis marina]